METNTQELSIIERSVEIFRAGGPILLANQQSSAKAIAVGQNILTLIREGGMTPELDSRAQAYLVNCSTALKEEMEGRAAITQLMDEIKKLYTGAEALIDIKKEGSLPNILQKERDAYAKKVAEEQKEKERLAQLAADKAKEAIEVREKIETLLFKHYSDFLAAAKSKILSKFNSLTLDEIDGFEQLMATYQPEYPAAHLDTFKPTLIFVKYLSQDEHFAILDAVKADKFLEYKANYAAELALYRDEIIDLVPSKRNELVEAKRQSDEAERLRQEAQRKADEAEKERQKQLAAQKDEQARKDLEAKQEQERKDEQARLDKIEQDRKDAEAKAEQERKQREAEAQQKILDEQAKAQQQQELESSIKAEGDKTLTLFEKETASVADAPAPETRTGYDIKVTHQAAYAQLFQFWFEREGKNLSIDKMDKTSLGQMRAFAEKTAIKTGEKIESKFLIYEDSYKAVNRKQKAE